MSIKIASMNFGDCDTILHNTPNGMKNIAEVLGPNGEVYWSATKELTGIPPLSIRSNGTILLDYLISGNMEQTGTPTPESPIYPKECGERTKNLFDKDNADIADLYPDATTREIKQSSNLSTWSIVLPVEPSTTYTFTMGEATTAIRRRVGMCSDYPTKGAYCTSVDDTPEYDHPNLGNIFTTDADTRYVLITYVSGAGRDVAIERANRVQVVKGNTALPYEPFGYKIPISSGGVNLFDKDAVVLGGLAADGSVSSNTTMYVSDYIRVDPNTVYTATYLTIAYWGRTVAYYDKNKSFISTGNNIVQSEDGTATYTMTTPNSCYYMRVATNIRITNHVNEIMLNRGSTPLPYEPYIEPTETNIYLGEVETTRKVKKLVLNGTENWRESSDTNIYIALSPNQAVAWTQVLSTHFTPSQVQTNGGLLWFVNANVDFDTVEECKTYLAAQYAAGTPVTVWYVLATPKTAVVNEPLRKIGAYADTVSYEQAGVQIPTNRGNTVIDVETELKPSQMYIKYK